MLYFAYGSNLSKDAMRARAPRANPIRVAALPGHRLVFECNEPAGQPEAFFAKVLEQIRSGYADWGLDFAVLEAALESASARIA